MLTSSSKIKHVNKRPKIKLNWLGSDQWIRWKYCDAYFNSALARLPWSLLKGPLKWDFLEIYLTTFSESVISEIQNLWASSFVSKYWKFNLHFKITVKNWEKLFFFWDSCIWIGIIKLPLLRKWYIWSAAQDLNCQWKRVFPTLLIWQWSMNILKVLWCWFKQCFGTFAM